MFIPIAFSSTGSPLEVSGLMPPGVILSRSLRDLVYEFPYVEQPLGELTPRGQTMVKSLSAITHLQRITFHPVLPSRFTLRLRDPAATYAAWPQVLVQFSQVLGQANTSDSWAGFADEQLLSQITAATQK